MREAFSFGKTNFLYKKLLMFSCVEFCLLNEDLQARLLWMDGIFLMARQTAKTKIELFALYNFYVEVFFEGDEPLFIKPLSDVAHLNVYLEMINLDSVYESINKKL